MCQKWLVFRLWLMLWLVFSARLKLGGEYVVTGSSLWTQANDICQGLVYFYIRTENLAILLSTDVLVGPAFQTVLVFYNIFIQLNRWLLHQCLTGRWSPVCVMLMCVVDHKWSDVFSWWTAEEKASATWSHCGISK